MRRCERETSVSLARPTLVDANSRRSGGMLVRILLACGVALIVAHFLSDFAMAQDAEGMADHGDFEAPRQRQSYLAWMYNALGLRYVLMFLLLNLASGLFIVLSLIFIVRGVSCPAMLVHTIRSHLAQNNWQAVTQLVAADRSYLGRLLGEALQHPNVTSIHAFALLRRREEHERAKVMNCVSYLALLAVLTALTGIIGFADGLIISMTVISHSTMQPKPSQLAHGFSMSLVTILVGFLMSWWLAIWYVILRNTYRRFVSRTNLVADELLGLYLAAASRT